MNYNKSRTYIELDEVMRQEENSGILHNATDSGNYENSFIDEFKFDQEI
jgi:hypothetical protein